MPEDEGTMATDDEAYALNVEEYYRLASDHFKPLNYGDIVNGVVVKVDRDEVLVDVGYKAEGIIPAKEISGKKGDPIKLNPGDHVSVFVLQPENEDGHIVLSLRRARMEEFWVHAVESMNTAATVEAEVKEKNKGGYIVSVLGLRGFLPASQIGKYYSANMDAIIGKKILAKVIEVDRRRNRLIISQKAAEEEDRAKRREEALKKLNVGDVVKGIVSSLTQYGAFVDIGGVEGLVHVSEISWDHVKKVSDVLHVGDEVSVKILKIDEEKGRLSLSLKQTTPDPMDKFIEKHPVGSICEGVVKRVMKYGAIVEFAPGVEGLLHVSEASWEPIEDLEQQMEPGTACQVKIINIDPSRRRISLSLKQLTAPPEDYEEMSASDSSDGSYEEM